MKKRKTHILILPNQLFSMHPAFSLESKDVSLVEENLFFGLTQHKVTFHKQKLWLHRSSMKKFEQFLTKKGYKVTYVSHNAREDSLNISFEIFAKKGVTDLIFCDPHHAQLEKKIKLLCKKAGISFEMLNSPMFLNSKADNTDYFKGKKKWFMADYYKFQRKKYDLLMDGDLPVGGKWSFDEDNRKKIPIKLLASIPPLSFPKKDKIDIEAQDYILKKYSDSPGEIKKLIYPTSHSLAITWLNSFLKDRFSLFGDYEDAIAKGENTLWHSVLTPLLNIGLLTPKQVIDAALKHADKHKIPLNSLEGFLRQIAGWREFMRATYEDLGDKMQGSNHWNHKRKIPKSFWTGTTGIDPLDDAIKRVIATGYCHHIERLMVIGGFMFLCEFRPKEIYDWFMDLFVDTFEWVMVPNVFGMSQNADGGLITSKPYFSGSSYIKKMSHYKDGQWSEIWDALYWRWIWKNEKVLKKNHRWAMMCSLVRKMDKKKLNMHIKTAENFMKKN